jgi:hypothetical protein
MVDVQNLARRRKQLQIELMRRRRCGHPVKGATQNNCEAWWSECGQYLITWRKEVAGVPVSPAYHACVQCIRSPIDRAEYLDFVDRRGLYRTRKAAEDACEKNRRVWKAFLALKDKSDWMARCKELHRRSIVGVGEKSHSMFTSIPVWVYQQADPSLLKLLRSLVPPLVSPQSKTTPKARGNSNGESVPKPDAIQNGTM